ncbi:MAG: hypothetical protein WCP03_00165 [Candidatus Saccharibacteria bacterium]
MKEQFNANEKWELDGYRWVKQDGLFTPANDSWQSLDLNPSPLLHPPIFGDICYVDVHPDCKNCSVDKRNILKQLALVTFADEEYCEANVCLVSPNTNMATNQDIILAPQETRTPFDLMISTVFGGPVFFSQLSQPVGFCDPDIANMFIAYHDFSAYNDFSDFTMGPPIIDEKNDSSIDYEQKQYEICKKLSCYLFSMDNLLDGCYDNSYDDVFGVKTSNLKLQEIDIESDYSNFFNNS